MWGDAEVEIGRPAHRRLLSLLILDVGRQVSTETLIDRFWTGKPPASARGALQTYVSQLRKILPPELVGTEERGYRLRIEEHRIDAHRFSSLASETSEARAQQDWLHALDSIQKALGLWRGEPYVELADDHFATPERTRLHEIRLTLEESRADALIGLGRHDEVGPTLERLVLEHPLRERMWELLIVARYRAGRTAEALRAYQEAAGALAEVGLEPGDSLREIEERVLAHDAHLGARSPRVRRDRRRPPIRRDWPFEGRDAERAAIRGILDSGRSVLLAGGAGVGKTRLAYESALVLELGEPVLITPSPSASRIPFGALSAHLESLSQTQASQPALLAQASDEIGSFEVPLIVDDVHHLDPLSAALLHQALPQRRLPSIVTLRAGEAAPAEIHELWKEGFLERLDVDPLDRPHLEKLVQSVLGHPVEGEVLDSLWHLSRGNVLYLRHLVEAAADDRTLVLVDGSWKLDRSLKPSPHLVDFVAEQIERSATGPLLQALAIMRPFEFDLLVAVAGLESLHAAEHQGLVQVERIGRRLLVSVSHPLLAEVAQETATESDLRMIRASMAEVVQQTGMRREEDVVRVAQLLMETGAGLRLEVAVGAARMALKRFDPALADSLLTAVRGGTDSHEARLLHARALNLLDRAADAFDVVEGAIELAEDDSEIADAALLGFDVLLFSDQKQRASSFVDRMLGELTDPLAKGRLVTEAALMAFVEGNPDVALDIGEALALAEELPDLARLSVLVTTTIVQPLTGHLTGAHDRVDEGLRLVESPDAPPLAVHQLRMNRQLIHQCEGRMEEAARVGSSHWAEVARSGGPTTSVGMVTADTLFERAEFSEVQTMYQETFESIHRIDAFGNRPHIHLWAATLALQVGWDELAERWESRAAPSSTDVRWVVRRHRIDAWKAASAGDLSAAQRIYQDAAKAAERVGYRLWLLYCLGDAIRLGHPQLVLEPLERLCRDMDGETAELFARHARALANRDGAALDAVSARYGHLGWTLRTAESAADAARVHSEAGRLSVSRRSAVRVDLLTSTFSEQTPPLKEAPPGLTPRELEVAVLAGTGSSNEGIASKLDLSLRTVENHLGRAYKKLGISGREDLLEVIGADRENSIGI